MTETKPEDEPSATPRERRRLKRKVLKQKRYQDERGFLVSEDVYEWESYSEDETTSEPVLKRKAPPASPSKNDSKKTAKKGSTADQKSLLSFWGRK